MSFSLSLSQSADGKVRLDVRLERESIWLTQRQMAAPVGRDQLVISRHMSRALAERYTDAPQGGSMRYRIAIHQSDEGYSVSVPGLPGCWSQGATDAEAVENIKDAIREYLAVVEDRLRGEEIREIDVAV